MLKFVTLSFLLFFSFLVKAQNQDTIQKPFENFFRSDCDLDTLILKSVRDSEIVFYKNDGRLMRVKEGDVKWEVDLNTLPIEYPNEPFCILQRGVEGKPRETYVFIYGSDGYAKLAIRSTNGKIVSK